MGKVKVSFLLSIFSVLAISSGNAVAYIEEAIPGSHYIYHQYYQTEEQAMSACVAFAASRGYDNHCFNTVNSDGTPTIFAGWLKFERYGQTLPFALVQFYHSLDCGYGIDVEYGCQGDKNSGDTCSSQTAGTNPINIGVGNKYQFEEDYSSKGVFPLAVSRHYNSTSGAWSFFPSIEHNPESDYVQLTLSDGKQLPFRPDGQSGWESDPDVTGSLERVLDGANNPIGWRYTNIAGRSETYNINGQLAAVTDRKTGVVHSYTYSPSDITVSHSNGDSLTYQINNNGEVTGFITPDNNQYNYSHDTGGRLTSISYPNNGGVRTYHYEDANYQGALTGITDENGIRFATWAYDSQGRAISSEHHGNAEKVTLDYTYVEDSVDPRVTATNPLGKQTTYHFTTIHGVRKVTQVEGHQSTHCAAANKAYTYDSDGFVASKTDWLGNLTNYTRDAKGQELTRTEAAGTSDERLFTTEWHPTLNVPTRIISQGYELIYSYDSSGNLISKQINELPTP